VHDVMLYDPIQVKVKDMGLLKFQKWNFSNSLSPLPFTMGAGK